MKQVKYKERERESNRRLEANFQTLRQEREVIGGHLGGLGDTGSLDLRQANTRLSATTEHPFGLGYGYIPFLTMHLAT